MPRQPRLVVPGYPHHVILRGNIGKTDKERQLKYKRLFLEDIPDRELNLIRFRIQKSGVIGSESFVIEMSKKARRKPALRPRGRPIKSF